MSRRVPGQEVWQLTGYVLSKQLLLLLQSRYLETMNIFQKNWEKASRRVRRPPMMLTPSPTRTDLRTQRTLRTI